MVVVILHNFHFRKRSSNIIWINKEIGIDKKWVYLKTRVGAAHDCNLLDIPKIFC